MHGQNNIKSAHPAHVSNIIRRL